MDEAAALSFLVETACATHFVPGGWIQLAIADATHDELVGDVGLYLSEDLTYAELGFTLDREHQGKGHATRAAALAVDAVFRLGTVLEVRAITDQRNEASMAVLRRAKFVQTGMRNAVFKGKACVELLFARGRSESGLHLLEYP